MHEILSVLSLLFALTPALAQAPDCASCGKCAPGAVIESTHCHYLEVKSVESGSPAAAVAIRPGDVLESYGGATVGCRADLARARDAVTTESVAVAFRRGDKVLRFLLPRGKLGVFLDEWQKDIVPDADAKLLAGVPRLAWEDNKSSTFIGAFEAALRKLGDKTDYVFLSGASGAAFRTHFFNDWCPSSPDPGVGCDLTHEILSSRGYEPRRLVQSPDGKNRPEMLAAIKASIDSGVPVLTWNIDGFPEHGLVVGYQKDGQELFVRTYNSTRKGYDLAGNVPSVVTILKKGITPKEDAVVRGSFAAVAGMLGTEQYGEYWNGLAAFDRWMERLRSDDWTALDSARFGNVVRANWWIATRLADDRATGIDFLRCAAVSVPEAATRLRALAALYEREVALLVPLVDHVPDPNTVIRPDQWTRPERDAQIAALSGCRALELEATEIWNELAGPARPLDH
jgi:hypothetical protein